MKKSLKLILAIAVLLTFVLSASAQSTRKFSLDAGLESESDAMRLVVNEFHSFGVDFLQYSSDGKYLCSASGTEIKIWDAEKGKLLQTVAKKDTLLSDGWDVSFSPDGKGCVCYAPDGRLKWIDVGSGAEKVIDDSLYGDERYMAFAPDGSRFAVCDERIVAIYDAKNFKRLYTLENSSMKFPSKVKFSPDSKYLFVIANNSIFYWNIKECSLLKSISIGVSIKRIDISPDGKYVAYLPSGKNIYVIDISSGKICSKIDTSYVDDFCFSPNGKMIFVADSSFGFETWDLKSMSRIYFSKDIRGGAIVMSPDGGSYAIGSYTGIQIHSAYNHSLVSQLNEVSRIGKWFYDSESDSVFARDRKNNEIYIFDKNFNFYDSGLRTYGGLFAGGLWSTMSNNVVLYDLKSRKVISKLGTVSSTPHFFDNSNDKIMAYYDYANKKVSVYDVKSKRKICEYKSETYVNRFITSGGKYSVSYDNINNTEIVEIRSGRGFTPKICNRGIAFSQNDKYCAMDGSDCSIIIYDSSTWKET